MLYFVFKCMYGLSTRAVILYCILYNICSLLAVLIGGCIARSTSRLWAHITRYSWSTTCYGRDAGLQGARIEADRTRSAMNTASSVTDPESRYYSLFSPMSLYDYLWFFVFHWFFVVSVLIADWLPNFKVYTAWNMNTVTSFRMFHIKFFVSLFMLIIS